VECDVMECDVTEMVVWETGMAVYSEGGGVGR
jgi:hypothetical protein